MKNDKGYQGSFAEFDDDLSYNDFDLRTYDPQIGRWLQQDPYDEFSSPYVGMGNDPVNLIDPSGGSVLGDLVGFAGQAAAVIPEVVVTSVRHAVKVLTPTLASVSTTLPSNAPRIGLTFGVAAGSVALDGAKTSINNKSIQQATEPKKEDVNKFPEFKTISKNYPRPYSPGPCSDGWADQCAIRVSTALRKSKVKLSGVKNKTYPGGQTKCSHGDVLGATNLANWLSDATRLGSPKKFDGTKDDLNKLLKDKKGIIYFKKYNKNYGKDIPESRSDSNVHIDLWDNGKIEADYLKQMLDSKEIWFWEMK